MIYNVSVAIFIVAYLHVVIIYY